VSLRSLSEAQHNFNTLTTQASGTPFVMIAPVAGRRLCVYRLIATVSAACQFNLQDTFSTPNVMTQLFQLGATGGISLDVPFNYDPWWYTGQVAVSLQAGIAAAQQGGTVNPAGLLQVGYGLGVNGVITWSTTQPIIGWDIWWDYHV
jgi:hypothetical protein